jgi:Xaa-Pro aminopeptidase
MRRRQFVPAILLAACISLAAQQISIEEYRERRAELRKALGDAVFIAFGQDESSGDIRTGFFQSADFYYLTGWSEPGAILVVTPKDDILLVPRHNEQQEKWTGRKLAPGDPGAEQTAGFKTLLPAETFESKLPEFLSEAERVYTLHDDLDKIRKLVPLRTVSDASGHIARLRSRKSATEIAMIQHSTDVTLAAHRAAWASIKPGEYEYQIAAVMTGKYFGAGCARDAYAPIVGSGPNAAVLHYSKNNRRMDNGELLLMDVAAECGMYASDITRTVPVNGKYTARQRELYEIVLGAQKAAIAAIKPGMTIAREGPNSLNTIVKEYLNTHGKDSHGEPLGKYLIHGIAHHVGLDVHDPSDISLPLEAGMVITVEPGLYLPEEGIGIRIEDVVLVTDAGAKILSAALPREADEIEKSLARSN